MSLEKFQDQYVGDCVGGLIREAATLKARCAYMESLIHGKDKEISELKAQLLLNGVVQHPEEYISKEPTTANHG